MKERRGITAVFNTPSLLEIWKALKRSKRGKGKGKPL